MPKRIKSPQGQPAQRARVQRKSIKTSALVTCRFTMGKMRCKCRQIKASRFGCQNGSHQWEIDCLRLPNVFGNLRGHPQKGPGKNLPAGNDVSSIWKML